MKMTQRSLAIVIFSIVIATFAAQHSGLAAVQAELRIKSGLPSVYITFERSGERKSLEEGESDEGIWLRLHNNTRSPLTLAMNDVPQEYGDAALFYEVLSDGKVVVERTCHVCSSNQISPGSSLLFSVPSEDLPERGAIRVRFNYGWERADDVFAGREPQHFVYFYSLRVPQQAVQNCACLRRGDLWRDPNGRPRWLNSDELKDRTQARRPIKRPGPLGRNSMKGSVTINVLINAHGKVVCAHGVKGHPIAVAAAVRSIRHWSFKPVIVRGKSKAIAGSLTVSYDFSE